MEEERLKRKEKVERSWIKVLSSKSSPGYSFLSELTQFRVAFANVKLD